MKASEEFRRGMLAALAVVALHGEDTIYDEIVRTQGRDELATQARKDGAMRWSGMDKCLRRARS